MYVSVLVYKIKKIQKKVIDILDSGIICFKKCWYFEMKVSRLRIVLGSGSHGHAEGRDQVGESTCVVRLSISS